ncbi:CHASE domain-containing protein [Candidatus Dojkabacteria bacterium]|uniref:histidine kinase n=1 Tax=Candidatus Dojkabacteria bacterium TaxID=2099670 RepID=A0A955RLW6_9BACT|nr:CHASE domain-containing protein [Candidatus Dojkabacteria bacterium]
MNTKKKDYLFLFLAFFFTLAIPFWHRFIVQSFNYLPNDFSFRAEVISIDNFFDEERNDYTGAQYSKTDYNYNVVEETRDILIIENSFEVKTPDDNPIFSVIRNYGINKKTGEHVPGYGDQDREGYLFAPKGISEGESFVYWHVNYDGPAQMNYVGQEYIEGIKVFHYETYYEDTRIDQTENLSYLPDVGITKGVVLEPHLEIWIEPETGSLINYKDTTTAFFYDLKSGEIISPWNKFSNRMSDESVDKNIEEVVQKKVSLSIVSFVIPLTLIVFAFLSLSKVSSIAKYFNKYSLKKFVTTVWGILIISTGLIILFGWHTQNEDLIRLGFIGNSTMNPITALSFVLIGSIVCIKDLVRKDYLSVLAIPIFSLSIFKFLGLFGLTNFHIDQALYSDFVSQLGSRMSVFTAVNFFLLSFALIIISIKPLRKLHMVAITSITSLLLSTLGLVGFIFNIYAVAVIPFFIYTSSSTALLMIIASILIFFNFRLKQGVILSTLSNTFIFGILLTSITLTILFAGLIDQTAADDARNAFQSEVVRAKAKIEERLYIYINALDGAKGLLSASENVSREEWKLYIDTLHIQENYPGIQGIGYAVFVKPEELEAHVKSIQDEGFDNYTIKPEGLRNLYSSIIYIEPFDSRNIQAFGYDMFQEPVRRAAMEKARDAGTPHMSGKITLVQEIDNDVQPGFLIYAPYYKNGITPNNIDERRSSILGYTYSPFRARDFVQGVIGVEGINNIGVKINDGVTIDESTQLYSDIDQKLDNNENSRFSKTETIYVAGRPWTISFFSSEDYAYTIYSRIAPLIILGMGIGVSILFTLIVYTVISSRQRAVLYANRVTKDLKQSQAKDEAILLGIGDGLVATDNLGKIILINKKFTELLGWTEEEVIGKPLTEIIPMLNESGELVPPEERTITKALHSEKKESESQSNVKYRTKYGKEFPVSITVSPIIIQNEAIGAVEVFRDITKEKQIDTAKTEFVSLASHQLRTPLTSINWYTELLTDDIKKKLTKEQSGYLSEIKMATKQMTELVGALLNVSRIELGTFAINPKPTDLQKLVLNVLEELKPIIKKKKLTVEINGIISKKISVDPKLFRMVYQNLITNSVKYTPSNGKISIDHKIENNKLTIRIKDNGYGIPEAQQKNVFEKLFRADNVRLKDTQGTGLGLYIVKSIIESSGGKIWFESKENKGTTFFIEIPLIGTTKQN